MKKNHYIPHEWNVVCDVCSKKIKASESRLRWDGFLVCRDDYEIRHEQDFVKSKQDQITVPYTRPVPEYSFTDVVYACTVDGKTAIAGLAVAGCSITGNNR